MFSNVDNGINLSKEDLIFSLELFLNEFDQILIELDRSEKGSNILFYSCLDQALINNSSNLSKLINYKSISGIRNESELFTAQSFPQSINLSSSVNKNVIVIDANNPSIDAIVNNENYDCSIMMFSNGWRSALVHNEYVDPNKVIWLRASNTFDIIVIRCYKKDPNIPNHLHIRNNIPKI